jgi:hypothetical protein
MSTKKRKAPSATPSKKATPPYKPSERAVEIEEAGLPKYLSCIIDGKLPKFENPPEKWGNADHIIPVDHTIIVLIEAVKKVNPQDYVVIPESFMLNMEMEFVDDEDEEYQKERIDKLLKQYKDKIVEILEQYKDKKRIYVCVNSSKWLNGPSHQNFICVMKETKQIIRFEPTTNNVRLEAFGIGKFWKQVAKGHGYTYEVIEKAFWLNQIHACRLNSLILALNHILDISIETFLGCFGLKGKANFLECDEETLRKFNFTVQDQLYKFLKNTKALPLPRPKSTRLKPVLSDPPETNPVLYNPPSKKLKTKYVLSEPPSKKLKTRLVFRSKKKSKLKKSKKINKQ